MPGPKRRGEAPSPQEQETKAKQETFSLKDILETGVTVEREITRTSKDQFANENGGPSRYRLTEKRLSNGGIYFSVQVPKQESVFNQAFKFHTGVDMNIQSEVWQYYFDGEETVKIYPPKGKVIEQKVDETYTIDGLRQFLLTTQAPYDVKRTDSAESEEE